MPHPTDVPTLADGVVTLRRHLASDAPSVWEQCQDPLSQRWTTVPVPYSTQMAHDFVTRTMPIGWAQGSEWGFALEVEGRYAGTVSLRDLGEGRAEIAYGSHPWARGRGLVERGLRLLLEWGFAERGLQSVLWQAHVGNWASRRLAWRLGFAVEGTLRQHLAQRGELRDAWVGTLLADDPREPRTPWWPCPVVEGRGLRLRPITRADAPRIHAACADAETQRWLGQLPSPYTLADAEAYVDSRALQLAEGTGETWAVTEPDVAGDEMVGTVGWFGHVPGVECEIGYWTHPEARGRGVARRALALATEHALQVLGVRRVACHAAAGNAASRRVIESSGFAQYGLERLGATVRDGRDDLALYDVLATEWGAAARDEAR